MSKSLDQMQRRIEAGEVDPSEMDYHADDYVPECPICGDGGWVEDPGPQEGCSEFASGGWCLCPAGRNAKAEMNRSLIARLDN